VDSHETTTVGLGDDVISVTANPNNASKFISAGLAITMTKDPPYQQILLETRMTSQLDSHFLM